MIDYNNNILGTDSSNNKYSSTNVAANADGSIIERLEYIQNLLSTISNLTAANIKVGVTILGVTGTYTSDADATAANIASGKTAYVNGVKLTGTHE